MEEDLKKELKEILIKNIEIYVDKMIDKIIYSTSLVSICPQCQKSFIKKHGNQVYCSLKCKEQYTNNHSDYYRLYRNRCKYLNRIYHDSKYKTNTYPIKELKSLYNEYKDFDNDDINKIIEFKAKLKNIK